MKKVIITGVNGQTGSYMAEFLLKHTGASVIGTHRSECNKSRNLEECLQNPRFQLKSVDLECFATIESLIKEAEPDYFINFAGQSSIAESWRTPEQTFRVNTSPVIHILENIRKYTPHCRFFNAGSGEEGSSNPYSASKLSARAIVKAYRDGYHLYAIQGTLHRHESERRDPTFVFRKISSGVARIKQAINSQQSFPPIELGNLETMRDFSHAEDFVLGIWIMLNQDHSSRWEVKEPQDEKERARRLAFNIREYTLASGETHSIREIVELAFKEASIPIKDVNPNRMPPNLSVTGKQINYTTEDGLPVVVSSQEFFRPADAHFLSGDASMARELLAWNPLVSFPELVRRMVANDLRLLEKP